MEIAIVGATGTLGAPLADRLESMGHGVRRLSRSSSTHPVDVLTGEGLSEALAGVEVVVGAHNAPPAGRQAAAALIGGTRRLLEATAAHHVCVSIVGIDELATSVRYYRTKVEQEEIVRRSGNPFTIVRATQFHDFVAGRLDRAASFGIELRSRALLQPVDVGEAADAIAFVATAPPTRAILTVAGPEVLTLSELRVARRLPLPVPLPPRLGRRLRAGALTLSQPDIRGTITYRQWLNRH